MTRRSLTRRRWLHLAAAAPVGLAVGCDSVLSPDAGMMGGGVDAGMSPDLGVCEPSTPDALGPFFEGGAPNRMVIAAAEEPGVRLLVTGTLLDAADCATPLGGYLMDIWQADDAGEYFDGPLTDYRLRGRFPVAADGTFALETIRPGNYETSAGPRPAHLHLRIYTPGGADRLITQLYFAGDPFLGADDGCQPPTCFSNDPGRILDLEPARIGGVDGMRGDVPLYVRR